MYFVDNNTAVEVMPPVGAALYTKIMWFTESGLGGRATYPGPDWFNIIQAEMMNVVSAAGIELKKSDNTQLTQAIKKIIANGKYLTIANNLSEIADAGEAAQAEARKNIALGTAATLDATTSATDDTPDRVLKVGDHGVGNTAVRATDSVLSSPTGYPSGFFVQDSDPDSNRYGSYGTGVHLLYSANSETGAFSGNLFVRADGSVIGEWLQINADGIILAQRVNELYGTLHKPTAADVGAVPQYDTVLNVDLNTLDGTKPGRYLQPMDAGALTEYHYPVSNAGSLDVIRNGANGPAGCTQEYRPFNTNVLYRRHSNIADSVVSWSGWNVEYSLEYQPPYPVTSVNGMTGDVTISVPDLSPYATQDWVRAYFVQSIRLSELSSRHFDTSVGVEDGAVFTNMDMVGGSSNVGNVYVRYIQQDINGVWAVVARL